MVLSPTLHSKELVNECYSACSMDHQATTGENAHKKRKKKFKTMEHLPSCGKLEKMQQPLRSFFIL